MSEGGKVTNHWDGDLLGRRQAAEFFYKFLIQQSESRSSEFDDALCIAVDADWGAGKTYFLDRLAKDVAASGHAVIQFNAWINDLDDDPLVGFMAAVKGGLTPILTKLPLADQPHLGQRAFLRKASRALWKGAKAVIAHQARKTIGEVGVAALTSVVQGDAADVDLLSTAEPGALEAGVDKLFQDLLDNHSGRVEAVASFKSYLGNAVEALGRASIVRAPMFIVIDELDRCRPDFAIRLLEGVKHVFGARNVCFVVGVNLAQTSESVKAVYGSGFDGRQYLKRFFPIEYRLPNSSIRGYCFSAVQKSPLGRRAVECGLPSYMVSSPVGVQAVGEALAFTAETLDLNPRAVSQVLLMCEAACSQSEKETIHLLYLFFLAVVMFRSAQMADALQRNPGVTVENIREIIFKIGGVDKSIQYDYGSAENYSAVMKMYWEVASSEKDELIRWYNGGASSRDYLGGLKRRLVAESISGVRIDSGIPISRYAKRLAQAGNLVFSGD